MDPDPSPPPRDSRTAFAGLEAALGRSLATLPPDGPLVVLFSGGVDSGVLAWELRQRAGLVLSTFGLEGSSDPVQARAAAAVMGLPLVVSSATPREVVEMARRVSEWAPGLSRVERSIETAFALAIDGAPAGPVVCGQGADELFFGYAHYRGVPRTLAVTRAEGDLARCQEVAWPRTLGIAGRLGRRVQAPYLDPVFAAAAAAVPSEVRWEGPPPKAFWRAFAAWRGVPAVIVNRPKEALQYGTGVDRRLARDPVAP